LLSVFNYSGAVLNGKFNFACLPFGHQGPYTCGGKKRSAGEIEAAAGAGRRHELAGGDCKHGIKG